MKRDDCIFCKLANGDIPTNMIYEDEHFAAIMDADPATKGHCLIIPKDHFENLYALPDDTAGGAMVLAKKLAANIKEKLECDGLNLVQNNGEVAGQTVMHFHLHIIPRYIGDGNEKKLGWNHTKLSDEETKKVREMITLK